MINLRLSVDSEYRILKSFDIGNSLTKSFLVNLIVTFIYFCTAFLSLKLAIINQNISPVWPPTGIAIIFVLLFGRNILPAIFFGAILANLNAQSPLISAALIAGGNTAEAFVGALILVLIFQNKSKLEEMTYFLGIAAAALLAPLVSASVGIATLYFTGALPYERIATGWITWWVADAVGALSLLPVISFFSRLEQANLISKFKKLELKNIFIVVLTIISFYAVYIFLQKSDSNRYLFLIFILVLLYSQLKNRVISALGLLTLVGLVIDVTLQGAGPFNLSRPNENLINLEIFLISVIFISLGFSNYFRNRQYRLFKILIVGGLIFWGLIYFQVQSNESAKDIQQLESLAESNTRAIESEFQKFVGTLTGCAALFIASDNVSAEEWVDYTNHIKQFYGLPGVSGVGMVSLVKSENVKHFIKNAQKTIDPNFKIKKLPSKSADSDSPTNDEFVITYIEPFDRNRNARGLDLASESRRRTAAIDSMTSGQVRISEPIQLVQDKLSRPGFLIYLPVYKKNSDVSTEASRQENFSHWIYSPVIAADFIGPFVTNFKNTFNLEIYDGLNNSELIFSENSGLNNSNYRTIETKLMLGGHDFKLKWSITKAHAASSDIISCWIGFVGSMSVLILSMFIVNIMAIKSKAEELTANLNNDFRESLKLIKQQENLLAENAKMASLGAMAAGIAHEINNPLSIIAGAATVISKLATGDKADKENEKLAKNSKRIIETSERISKIIQGLRQFSRDGRQDPPQLVRVDQIIEEAMSLCRQTVENNFTVLKLKLDYVGEIECREVQIVQVILNLIGNSFDAIENLQNKWIELETLIEENNIIIRVKDSGPGVPAEIQDKILEPFYTTKLVGKGTGLGLSISKGIAEAHGGKITINNSFPFTCFELVLPRPVKQQDQIKLVA